MLQNHPHLNINPVLATLHLKKRTLALCCILNYWSKEAVPSTCFGLFFPFCLKVKAGICRLFHAAKVLFCERSQDKTHKEYIITWITFLTFARWSPGNELTTSSSNDLWIMFFQPVAPNVWASSKPLPLTETPKVWVSSKLHWYPRRPSLGPSKFEKFCSLHVSGLSEVTRTSPFSNVCTVL